MTAPPNALAAVCETRSSASRDSVRRSILPKSPAFGQMKGQTERETAKMQTVDRGGVLNSTLRSRVVRYYYTCLYFGAQPGSDFNPVLIVIGIDVRANPSFHRKFRRASSCAVQFHALRNVDATQKVTKRPREIIFLRFDSRSTARPIEYPIEQIRRCSTRSISHCAFKTGFPEAKKNVVDSYKTIAIMLALVSSVDELSIV